MNKHNQTRCLPVWIAIYKHFPQATIHSMMQIKYLKLPLRICHIIHTLNCEQFYFRITNVDITGNLSSIVIR